jgi:hypothetical protein
VTMNGPAALRWRQLSIEDDAEEVRKRFNEEMRGLMPEGVTAEFDHFLGLDDFHLQLMGIVKISCNMGTATGKRVFLPGVFFESRAKHPFVAQEHRSVAVDMGYADSVSDRVTYRFPESFTVESAPADTSIPWTGHAQFVLKSETDKDKSDITVIRNLVRNFTLLQADDYTSLHDFYQKIATADQQPLVLTAAPARKGN